MQASAADVPTAPKTVNERLTQSCLDRLQLLEDVRSRVPSVAERRDDYLVTLGHKVIESSLEGIHIAVMAVVESSGRARLRLLLLASDSASRCEGVSFAAFRRTYANCQNVWTCTRVCASRVCAGARACVPCMHEAIRR